MRKTTLFIMLLVAGCFLLFQTAGAQDRKHNHTTMSIDGDKKITDCSQIRMRIRVTGSINVTPSICANYRPYSSTSNSSACSASSDCLDKNDPELRAILSEIEADAESARLKAKIPGMSIVIVHDNH